MNEFTAITGADSNTANQYLRGANGNLQLALSNYFDAGLAPATNFQPLIAPPPQPPPPLQPPPLQPPPLQPPPPLDDGEFPVIAELSSGSKEIPLKAISVVLTVNQYVAQVQVLHRFYNKESNPIEAIFTFQQEDVSIYEFYAEIGGKKIASVIKEKEQAFNAYDDAISAGGGGYLLDKASDDKFNLNVGNLPPKTECVISVKYATVLSTEGDALKVSVPITRVALREVDSSTGAERFPNGLTVTANIQMASPIVGIESETHDIQTEINGNKATLSLNGNPLNQPARDLIFLIGVQDPHKTANSIVEVLNSNIGRTTAMMLSFYPKIENLGEEILMEYIFLVDRSGSMSGSKNTQLVNALQLFLRSIPVGSLFNIVGFGSTFEWLFPSSVTYDDSSFAKATQHAASLKANLGGTNILPPLRAILNKPSHPKFPRQVFILTDGEVDNTEEVIKMVKKNIRTTRIFTLGIGAEASKRLVKGIARAGKGQAELVASGTRMEPKVLAQLKRAMQPHLAVEIDWGTIAYEVEQAPAVIPPAFPGLPIVVFGLLLRDSTTTENVALKLIHPNGEIQRVPVSINGNSSEGTMVGVLAASYIISDLERKIGDREINESEAKKTIVPLALKYSLVTKYTSLVAQEVRETAVEGNMEVRKMGETAPEAQEPQNETQLQQQNDDQLAELQQTVNEIKLMSDQIKAEIGHSDMLLESLDAKIDQSKTEKKYTNFYERRVPEKEKSSGGVFSFFTNLLSSPSPAPAGPPPPPALSSAPPPPPSTSSFAPRSPADSRTMTFCGVPPSPPSSSYLHSSSRSSSYSSPSSYADTSNFDGEFSSEPLQETGDSINSKDDFSGFTYAAPSRASDAIFTDDFGDFTPGFAEVAPIRKAAGSLFGDDDDDDLFGGKPKKATPHKPLGSLFEEEKKEDEDEEDQEELDDDGESFNKFTSGALFDDDDDNWGDTFVLPPPLPLSSPPPAGANAPAPAPAPVPAPVRVDPFTRQLDRFIVLQQAAGNWTLSPDFLAAIGKTKAQISAAFGAEELEISWKINVIATALAVTFLVMKFAVDEDEWSLLKDKATRWMTKEINENKSSDGVAYYLLKARSVLE